ITTETPIFRCSFAADAEATNCCARISGVIPLSETVLGRHRPNALPSCHMILDQAALTFVRASQPKALPHLAERTAAEVATASMVSDEHGWSADPVTSHRRPPRLAAYDLPTVAHRGWPLRHESASFASGFQPRNIEPAAERWRRGTRNDTVHVRLLR